MGNKAESRVRVCFNLARKPRSDSGAMLVEVLVATTILLLVFTGVVQQVSNLATIRVRIETRDRAVAYANSLQQIMSANGCGFDVDTVEETVFEDQAGNPIAGNSDSYSGSDQVALKGPWSRVQGCAFSALENVRQSDESSRVYSYVDVNEVVHLTVNENGTPSFDAIDKTTARNFCEEYGEEGSQYTDSSCELGDQEFVHMVSVNDDGIQTRFDVKVNYWFELVGGSASGNNDGLGRKSECSSIVSSGKLPDTLARRVEVEFPNGRGGKESFVITKRENVPVDSFQFASGTRVGVAVGTGESVSMYPSPGLQDPWKVSRDRVSEDACVWFPYIARHQAGDRQPAFSVDGVGAQEATLADLQALQTGTL